jgi:hypothetical protein
MTARNSGCGRSGAEGLAMFCRNDDSIISVSEEHTVDPRLRHAHTWWTTGSDATITRLTDLTLAKGRV